MLTTSVQGTPNQNCNDMGTKFNDTIAFLSQHISVPLHLITSQPNQFPELYILRYISLCTYQVILFMKIWKKSWTQNWVWTLKSTTTYQKAYSKRNQSILLKAWQEHKYATTWSWYYSSHPCSNFFFFFFFYVSSRNTASSYIIFGFNKGCYSSSWKMISTMMLPPSVLLTNTTFTCAPNIHCLEGGLKTPLSNARQQCNALVGTPKLLMGNDGHSSSARKQML
jgi:hypothetical protein